MLKYSLAAGLLACAALTPVAFAQDKQASSGGGKIQFVQTIDAQEFRGSELMGQTVYNDQDEAIGDIGDALLDKSGKVSAVIIDVGGFLGIGAREVGVPFNALRFERAPETAAASPAAGGNDPSSKSVQDARSSAGGPPPTAGSGAATDPAGSANTGTGGAAQSAAQGESGGAMSRQIDSANQSSQEATSQSALDNVRIVLNTSREELQNAPEIKNPGESQESGASSGSGASGSSAPAK
jgi:sporulation protein YlmC with PRC-barrel domain